MACGDTDKTHKAFEQAFPIACPKCAAVQAAEGFPCLGCKRIIPQRPREVTVFHCPHTDCNFKYSRRALGG